MAEVTHEQILARVEVLEKNDAVLEEKLNTVSRDIQDTKNDIKYIKKGIDENSRIARGVQTEVSTAVKVMLGLVSVIGLALAILRHFEI